MVRSANCDQTSCYVGSTQDKVDIRRDGNAVEFSEAVCLFLLKDDVGLIRHLLW